MTTKSRKGGEGQVYRCTWNKRGKHFLMKSLSPVKIQSLGIDLETAKNNLLAQIMDTTGDGEAQLQFVPPLPEPTGKNRFSPEYFHLKFNEFVDFSLSNQDELYSGSVCQVCRTGLGSRTDVSRIITSLSRYDVVGFRNDHNVRMMFSGILLEHLSPFIKDRVTCNEVHFESKLLKKSLVKKFFEIDFQPIVEVSVPKKHDKLGGWRCPKCKTQVFLFTATKLRPTRSTFILRSFAKGKVLLLGKGPFRVIAVDAELHKKIMDDKRIKGFVSDRLVIVEEDEALSADELRKVKLPAP